MSMLPQPSAIAQQRSSRLSDRIKQHIASAGGAISFADYMQLALYEPELGYYSAHRAEGGSPFGATGDFITAAEHSTLFSACLAAQYRDICQHIPNASILEFGAGSGRLASRLLTTLRDDTPPQQYHIVEISPARRQQQQATLFHDHPDFHDRLNWLDDCPPDFSGLVILNEVLDAFPVARFCKTARGLQEIQVVTQEDTLALATGDVLTPDLLPLFDQLETKLGPLAVDYQSEINTSLTPWLANVAKRLSRAVVLIIDYGYPRDVYYHPQRHQGTLRCHYQHHYHDQPLFNPGLQDITAHVDFSHVADCAQQHQLAISGYSTQASFLINCGLLSLAEDIMQNSPTEVQLACSQDIQRLVQPQHMGEVFKVMALTADFDAPLLGFDS